MGLTMLMTTPSARVTASWSVADACEVMSQERAGAVPITESGDLCGIFTYRDLIDRVLLTGKEPETTPVGEVMTREVQSLRAGSSHGTALRLMVDSDYTYVPVVKDDGGLVGMVSLKGVLESKLDHLASQLDLATSYATSEESGVD